METAVLIAFLAGALGIPAVNFLKGRLGWSGDRVKLLAGAVSGILAVVGLALACVISIVALACYLPLTWDTASLAIAAAFGIGQLIYLALPKA